MIKEVTKRRSKLGRIIDETDYSQIQIAKYLSVEQETVSKWCTLNSKGQPKQTISTSNLQNIIGFLKEKCGLVVDPTDLLEEPDYYINNLTIIGELKANAIDLIPYSKQKQETFQTKYPPDCYSIVFKRNINKYYYFVFEDIERNPESSIIHGADALLKLKNGKIILGLDMEIFGNQFRYKTLSNSNNKKALKSVKKVQVEYFSLMTDVNIVYQI